MKGKLLLTRVCRSTVLLLALVIGLGTTARASHTINIMNNSAVSGGVYIYATDQDGTLLTEEWPGTQLTATTTVQNVSWFTKTFTGATQIKFKINLGGASEETDNTATALITTMGSGGHYYYEYDPSKYQAGVTTFDKYDNVTDYYDLPAGVTYESSNVTVYFINTNQWTTPYVYISNGYSGYGNQNNDWPGDAMTKVGTNSNGWDIYKWSNNYPNNPSIVIFSNQGANQSADLAYTRNGVYSGYNYATLATVSSEREGGVIYNTPTYFYDQNMRAALTDALGVPSGPANSTDAQYAIATKSVKVLDISNKGISNLGSTSAGNTNGINYFTELEELYAGNNSIKHGVLTSLTKLKVLDMHGNTGLKGFGVNTATASGNPILNIPTAANDLVYVDLSNCALTYLTALKNRAPNVETLKIANNSSFADNDYSSFANLKYLDYSGCDATPATVVSNFTSAQKGKLEYLDLSNNNMSASGNDPALNGFTALKTFKFGSQARWTGTLTATGCTALETVDLTGNVKMTGLTLTNDGLTDLTTNLVGVSTLAACTSVDVSNNSLTTLNGVEDFPALTALVAKNNAFTTLTYTGHSVPQKIELSNNTSMTSANLSGNAIQKAAFMGCTNLTTLDISNNQIESLCANWQDNISSYSNWTGSGKYLYIAGLSNLVSLDISDNNISEIGANASNGNNSLRGLTSLTTLDASNNAIYSISTPVSTSYSSLQPLTALENLDLSGNSKNSSGGFHLLRTNGLPLKNVNLSNNSNIDEITVYNGELTDIGFGSTNGISDFTKLSKLDVTGNKLVNVTVPRTPNTLLSIDMSNNTLLQSVVANHDNNGTNSKLRYIEVDGCTALTNFTLTGADLYYNTQDDYLNASNNPNLVTMNLSDDAISSADITVSGFQSLATIDLSDNTTWAHGLTVTNCPALTTVDVENNTSMSMVAANNGGYSNSSYPLVKTTSDMNLSLYFNQNNFSAIPAVTSGVKYLYLQENAFAQNLTLDGDAIALKGIALSNKSTASPIKTFTASVASPTLDEWAVDFTQTPPAIVRSNSASGDGSNMTLEAINLKGNTSLDSIKVNGFKALTKLASGDDMSTEAGKGLYVKGLTSLKKLDISNNRIETLGENASLEGLSGLLELNASHNKIRTLTNKSKLTDLRTAYGKGTYTSTTTPNIEDLIGLKKLNLSHNLICDSIHLWKNTALEWLDVSYNRIISQRAVGDNLYYLNPKTGVMAQWKQTTYKVQRDPYTGDTNDTIGLRMLDLYFQTNLKYLDISATNIRNTASSHFYMANFVDPSTLTTSTTSDNQGHTVGRNGVPHFVLVSHLPALEEIHINYNGMQSLGIGSTPGWYNNAHTNHQNTKSSTYCNEVTGCPNLKYVEAKEMNGIHPAIMQAEIRISANNPLIEHYDVSGGGWDYVGAAAGANLTHLRYINVSNNYNSTNVYTDNGDGTWTTTYTDLNGRTHSYTVHGDPFVLNVEGFPALDTVLVSNTPHLTAVNASHTDNLEVLDVTQDQNNNDLIKLFVNHSPKLDVVGGLATLNHLQVYHANDSHFTGSFVMPTAATTTLRDLRVSNETLAAAATRNNLTSVPLTGYTKLERVDAQNNPSLSSLDLYSSQGTMSHLNIANCHFDNDGVEELADLAELTYLNASNDDNNLPTGSTGNWLTELPLSAAVSLDTLIVGNNELYKIDVNSTALRVVDFHNNHINGIDLSKATSLVSLNAANNGRKIKANKHTTTNRSGGVDELYYFQLSSADAGNQYGGTYVGDRPTDMYLHSGTRSSLTADNFDVTKATFSGTVVGNKHKNNANSILGPGDVNANDVYGTIVVLDPTATRDDQSSVSYTYDVDGATGNNTAEFYLDWDAEDAIVTGVDELPVNGDGVTVNGSYGGLVITAPAGTVLGVYDMAGRLVQQATAGDDGTVLIDGLTPGIYVVAGQCGQFHHRSVHEVCA